MPGIKGQNGLEGDHSKASIITGYIGTKVFGIASLNTHRPAFNVYCYIRLFKRSLLQAIWTVGKWVMAPAVYTENYILENMFKNLL